MRVRFFDARCIVLAFATKRKSCVSPGGWWGPAMLFFVVAEVPGLGTNLEERRNGMSPPRPFSHPGEIELEQGLGGVLEISEATSGQKEGSSKS